MPPAARIVLVSSALLLLAATGLGAWASHGLAGSLDASALASVSTAVAYQFYHGLGALAAGLLLARHPDTTLLKITGALFLAGIALFCGGIYAHHLLGFAALGSLAPVGGVAFMAGWLALAIAVLRLPPAGELP